MKAYKEGRFLVFDFGKGEVRYDLKENRLIGKSGRYVNSVNQYFSNMSIDNIIDCMDGYYANFLRFVRNKTKLQNFGSLLKCVRKYSRYEQIFSSGVTNVRNLATYTINDISSGLLKICREHGLALDVRVIESYKQRPDMFNVMYSMKYREIDDEYLNSAVSYCDYYTNMPELFSLQDRFNYNFKRTLEYLDYLAACEAIDDPAYAIRELIDYASVSSKLSNKFDKYPKNFLTAHRIASRNYNRLKQEYDNAAFERRRDESLEWRYGDYMFLYPKTIQDIKDEAVQQHNCVASYINRVINGECHIMFMRNKFDPSKSLVTLEVVNKRIVQARREFNRDLSESENEAVNQYNNRTAQN